MIALDTPLGPWEWLRPPTVSFAAASQSLHLRKNRQHRQSAAAARNGPRVRPRASTPLQTTPILRACAPHDSHCHADACTHTASFAQGFSPRARTHSMLADVAVAKGRRWEHLVRSWEHPSNHEQDSINARGAAGDLGDGVGRGGAVAPGVRQPRAVQPRCRVRQRGGRRCCFRRTARALSPVVPRRPPARPPAAPFRAARRRGRDAGRRPGSARRLGGACAPVPRAPPRARVPQPLRAGPP
jgi:hypothetical protein